MAEKVKKRVLLVYYSQSGRTKDIVDRFVAPIKKSADVQLDEIVVTPEMDFPYPWSIVKVLSIIPEVILEKPTPIVNAATKMKDYDLVILGGQVWFLSCSWPLMSFLKHQKGNALSGVPVVPVVTFRRAWSEAYQCIKKQVESLGGFVLDRIVIQAKDKKGFPLLKVFSKKMNEKEWYYDLKELEKVDAAGNKLVELLEKRDKKFPESPFGDPFSAVNRSVKSMSRMERKIYKMEKPQKARYIKWAKFIRSNSTPHTFWRGTVAVLFSIFYLPFVYRPFYLMLPFALVLNYTQLALNSLKSKA